MVKGTNLWLFFIAVLTGLGLWALGMPLVLTLALIAGLLDFIPNFGPIIALVPAILIALTMGQTTAILVACLYTFIQVIQSAATQPLISKKDDEHPARAYHIWPGSNGLAGRFLRRAARNATYRYHNENCKQIICRKAGFPSV